MLVTFTTDSYSNITMFGDIGISMLEMMGHSTTVPGAILAADVPEALRKLTAAVDADKTQPLVVDEDTDETEVSIANRAIPLIDLLTAAVNEKSDVMWK
ncbi:DUF1840 domain-containing protein [uncultured Neptuniibacter sp.]|uniref:DUF1840 domain-containing protein n=1 Tax=uncultured Neptuniibacter sp. TaxID=502143 RepID=UPI0026025417|nr:DUF1840 domain-containing protein [uncultured Neptuniibacter sp.]